MAKTLQQLEAEKREAQARKDALYDQYKIDQQIARENARFEEDLTPAQRRQLVKEQTANSYATYKAAESKAADADWEVEKYNNTQAGLADFGPNATYQESGGGTSTVFRQTSTGNTQQLSGNDPVNQPYAPNPPISTPQSSTADQPIPFISDETYLDPLYEPVPASGADSPIPYISDENYLKYGDYTSDPMYEPVPTDDELASIQEQLDEDAEFAAIDEEFANIAENNDAIRDDSITTGAEADYILSGSEFEDFEGDPEVIQPPAPPPPYTPELYKPRSIHDARSTVKDEDWRFRVQLSPYADYLYKGPNPGILAPLLKTDGVIFPYMPNITMTANAVYNDYNPTHSNFRGAWYKSSQQNDVIVNATFTAQDTAEAQYMLAAMHFFRACTKMFYGQDQRRGSPPPLLYLNGLGEHQFNEHPCVLTFVTYTLPDNVDYIKTENSSLRGYSPGANKFETESWNSWSSQLGRLMSSGLGMLFGGGEPSLPNPNDSFNVFQTRNGATYVPTSLQLQMNFMPINSRQQHSTEWSTREFANGNLLKKGYW